jgi:F420-non-reducing hydrogenase iron-sulfur subunit
LIALLSTYSDIQLPTRAADATVAVTAFICANCARPSHSSDSADRSRPTVPTFDWPFSVEEILVPCTGRLQPEHVLKSFELGADLVCVVACDEDNCHHLEGSMRCARRVDYLRDILDEVGLGGDRLMLFHLRGSAAEDMARNGVDGQPACIPAIQDPRVAAIRVEVLRALDHLTQNPLYTPPAAETAEDPYQEVDTSDDANEE